MAIKLLEHCAHLGSRVLRFDMIKYHIETINGFLCFQPGLGEYISVDDSFLMEFNNIEEAQQYADQIAGATVVKSEYVCD